MIKIAFALIVSLLVNFSLFSNTHHYINGLFGDKAVGMGGAYTAVSDDSSGCFYNPAGLIFSSYNVYSISSLNYKSSKNTYENAIGMGIPYQIYDSSYIPAFVGSIFKYKNVALGFSLLSQDLGNINRTDEIDIPIFFNERNIKINMTSKSSNYTLGPSVSILLSNNFSIGFTLYSSSSYIRSSKNLVESYPKLYYKTENINDEVSSQSVIPKLGLQYMITEKIVLGFTFSKNLLVNESRHKLFSIIDSDTLVFNNILFYSGTKYSAIAIQNNRFETSNKLKSEFPSIDEYKFGIANYTSKDFLFSFDLIYSNVHNPKINKFNLLYDQDYKVVVNNYKEDQFSKVSNINYAFGLEYFFTDFISLRMGIYTNHSNTKNKSWNRVVIERIIQNQYPIINYQSIVVRQGSRIPSNSSWEHIDLTGITMGLSYISINNSISLNVISETGRGIADLDESNLPQALVKKGIGVYVSTSIFR